MNAESMALILIDSAALKPDAADIKIAKSGLSSAIDKCFTKAENENDASKALAWSKPMPLLLAAHELIAGKKVEGIVPFAEIAEHIYVS